MLARCHAANARRVQVSGAAVRESDGLVVDEGAYDAPSEMRLHFNQLALERAEYLNFIERGASLCVLYAAVVLSSGCFLRGEFSLGICTARDKTRSAEDIQEKHQSCNQYNSHSKRQSPCRSTSSRGQFVRCGKAPMDSLCDGVRHPLQRLHSAN